MIKRNKINWVHKDFAQLREDHFNILSDMLKNFKIEEVHRVDLDKIYVNKLKNINILEEFFNEKKLR